MKILNFLSMLLLGVALTSCLGGDNKMTSSRALQAGSCVNYIVDNATGEGAINASGANYVLNIDYTSQVADITVSGLQLTPGGASYTFNIPAQRFYFDASGALIVDVPAALDADNDVTINNFRLSLLDRMMGQDGWIPVWTISYEVNSRFTVSAIQLSTVYFGSSNVKVGDDKSFDTKEPYYSLVFDSKSVNGSKMKGKLLLYNAQFASSMPKMNMAIRDIEFDFGSRGFNAHADELELYLNDTTLQPEYAITNFSLSATYQQSVFGEEIYPCCNISFTCAGRFKTLLELGYDLPAAQ